MPLGTDRLDHFVFSGSTKVQLKQIGAAGRLWKEGDGHILRKTEKPVLPAEGRKDEAWSCAEPPSEEGS